MADANIKLSVGEKIGYRLGDLVAGIPGGYGYVKSLTPRTLK